MDLQALRLMNQLIPALESFLETKSELTENWTADFGEWLKSARPDTPGETPEKELTDMLIGFQLITILNRLRSRMNRFVARSPFSTFMDYQFLYVVGEHRMMTKSELIDANSMEMSSGIEVVNRLLKNRWISETVNPEDRRSKIVSPTPAGKAMLAEYRDSAGAIYTSVSCGLSADDRKDFLQLLSRVTGQHHTV